MKVLFMFSGLPHYYNLILSRLNNIEGLEIIVVVPKEKQKTTLGSGVHQTKDGINFKVYHLDRYKAWYKYFFKDFDKLVEKEKPDIIVTIFEYAYSFLTHFRLRRIMSKYDIKLIYKDIPFRLPYLKDAQFHHAKALGLKANDNFIVRDTKYAIAKVFTLICKKLYNRFDAIVNYVEEGRNIFSSYGVQSERIFTTYNSLDTEILADIRAQLTKYPSILPPNQHRIFHIGRLVEWKRVDLLINAVHRLTKSYPNIELLVIGKGPLLEQYKVLVNDLGIEKNVVFLGAIYDDIEKARYFTSCSLYVLAGMGGLSINEAMSYGLPVLCSVCDGTEKHLVYDSVNGKYFKDGSLEDLTSQLDNLLSDTERLKEMGIKSLDIIKNQINVHTVLSGYVTAFNYVTQNKYAIKYTNESQRKLNTTTVLTSTINEDIKII